MRPSIKFLHTSDLHLGAKFTGLGARGIEQRRRLREAFQDISVLAIRERVDLVLLAGDTFDQLNPSPESLSAFHNAVRPMINQNIIVVMIAGTHDYLKNNAVLPALEAEYNGRLVLLTPGRPAWENADHTVSVQGVSLLSQDEPARPLASLRRLPGEAWQIGMAHGSLEMPGQSPQEARFSAAEIAATGLDYLALGHWHGLRDCSQKTVTAWYSGAPEMVAFDQAKAGSVLIVSLEEGRRPEVTPQPIGKRSLLQLTCEAADLNALLERIRPLADSEAVLELTLSGTRPAEGLTDLQELRQALQPLFFHVALKDVSSLEISPKQLDQFSEATVIGRFVRLIQQELSQTKDEAQRKNLNQALQLGLAMLMGREAAPWY